MTAIAERRLINVTKIEEKQTSKGKPMWRVTDDKDDFYSVFEDFTRARIRIGETNSLMVKVEEIKGKTYKNITGIAEALAVGDVATDELLPGSKPAPSQNPQQMSVQTKQSNPPRATPPPSNPPRPAAPATVSPMVVRMKALELAVSLAVAGQSTFQQIEANANSFVGYIINDKRLEQQNGSESEGSDEFVA